MIQHQLYLKVSLQQKYILLMHRSKNVFLPAKIQQKTDSSYFSACLIDQNLQITILQKNKQYNFKHLVRGQQMHKHNGTNLYTCLYYHYIYHDKTIRSAWNIRDQHLQIIFDYPNCPQRPIYFSTNNKSEQTRNLPISKDQKQSSISTQQQIEKIMQKHLQKAIQKLQYHLSLNIEKINQQYELRLETFGEKLEKTYLKADSSLKQAESRLMQMNRKSMTEFQLQISSFGNNLAIISQNIKQLQNKLQDSNYLKQEMINNYEDLQSQLNQKISQQNEKFKDLYNINQKIKNQTEKITSKIQKNQFFLSNNANCKQCTHHSNDHNQGKQSLFEYTNRQNEKNKYRNNKAKKNNKINHFKQESKRKQYDYDDQKNDYSQQDKSQSSDESQGQQESINCVQYLTINQNYDKRIQENQLFFEQNYQINDYL